MIRPSVRCRFLLPAAALALAAAPPVAGEGGGALQPDLGSAGPALVDLGGRYEVARGDRRTALELAPATRLTSFEPLSDGWVAAGHRPGPAGSELVIVAGEGGRTRAVPPPAAVEAGGPVVFVRDGAMAGLAWLEGARQEELAVRASTWSGVDWGEPATVAGPGAGSQVALAAAVLDDGSWLLVWTAFDGTDDETVWSVFDGREWSASRRLAADNAVPDVLPGVVAADGGALAAWSRFDGSDYRLVLHRFDAATRSWEPVPLASARGSLRARFLRRPQGFVLLYRSVVPAAWTAVDFDRGGRPLRRAAVASAATAAPRLAEDGAGRLVWIWATADGPGGLGDEPRRSGGAWEPLP